MLLEPRQLRGLRGRDLVRRRRGDALARFCSRGRRLLCFTSGRSRDCDSDRSRDRLPLLRASLRGGSGRAFGRSRDRLLLLRGFPRRVRVLAGRDRSRDRLLSRLLSLAPMGGLGTLRDLLLLRCGGEESLRRKSPADGGAACFVPRVSPAATAGISVASPATCCWLCGVLARAPSARGALAVRAAGAPLACAPCLGATPRG